MNRQRAILAGGCFWGMQELFRALPGVLETRVGYSGGSRVNPRYDDMKSPDNQHAESIEIFFDADMFSYRKLLEFFFQIHDPTTPNRQGNDRGTSYRSIVFYEDAAQHHTAETLIAAMEASGRWPGKIVTELLPATAFYPAEAEHQDYLQRHPNGYSCHFPRPRWVL